MNQILAKELFTYKNGFLYWKNDNKSRKVKNLQAGSLTNKGYICVRYMGKQYFAHRLIYLYFHGHFPKYIDHINAIKTDNRIENLRKCTTSENKFNVKKISTNTSKHKNVTWHKKIKKWQVGIQINGKFCYFGVYKDLELADLVAQEARDKYIGRFACHD
jgi:hypothetical protein